ncbi:YIR protein [Plasmodium yoelii]|uniref:YIR protein n=1 Tax=Plasmodium yoelii TaxID=5861 RepID=A0A077X6I3_PLAYE|nr:YIR protein [Plasmodium yoelii]
MSKELCDIINWADNYVVDDPNNSRENMYDSFFNSYCPDKNCDTDDNKVSSTFISLLNLFDGISDEYLENDRLAEYAILWLSYRLNQKTESETTTLYDFYTENIKKNSKYNEDIATDSGSKTKKEVIDAKIESMNIDIKDISNFYDAFKSLNAGELFEKYEKLKNDLDINKGSSYYKLLSSLSNDYKIFEYKYNNKCISISQLVACPRSSLTKNMLITIAIIFVAASILLGVSYKYSLFGFRKRSQKQHLREMVKK